MNVIGLIRVSTDNQAGSDKASIPAQRAVIRTTAARYGLKIVTEINIADVSGADVLLAPEIQRLIELIQSPTIGGVVTREFSRLMRPEKFSDYALLQAFADTNTKLYLPEGPIDFSEKTGRLMGTIRAAIAGLERSEILERVRTAKEEKRRAGGCPVGSICIPQGVGYDKQRGWHYTDEAKAIRRAFDLLLAGHTSYRQIQRRCGIKAYNLRNLLRNPIFNGWRVYDQKKDPTRKFTKADGRQGGRPMIARAPEEVIRVRVIDPPLVTDAEWERAQAIIGAKTSAWRRDVERGRGHWLYNGFLFCAACGAPLVEGGKSAAGVYDRPVARYYVCKNRKFHRKTGRYCDSRWMVKDQLEAAVDEVLSREVTSLDFARRLARKVKDRKAPGADKLASVEAEIRKLETKRGRVVDAFIEGVLNREQRDKRLAGIDSDLAGLKDEAARLTAARVPQMSHSQIVEAFSPFMEWPFLVREQRRRLLSCLIPRITVHNYEVTGFYRIFGGGMDVQCPPSNDDGPGGISGRVKKKRSYTQQSQRHSPAPRAAAANT